MIYLKDYKKEGFDSVEEFIVFIYLIELKKAGYISNIKCQPKPFQLYEGLPKKFYKLKQLKTKISKIYRKAKHLLKPRIYTADFKFGWIKDGNSKWNQNILSNELDDTIPFISNFNFAPESYLEVKPVREKYNMIRLFTSRTQPWVYAKFGIYVQLIKPYKLMEQTFIPKEILHEMYYKKDVYTGKGDKRKLKAKKGDQKYKWNYLTLEDYINEK